MARSSRHKSHRSHKHRDLSDSEDEGSSRDRKQKAEEEESARVSRVLDQEKRKSSSKDGIGTSNGDISGDHGKKRKDRGDDSTIGGDRWNGRGDDDARVEKESKKEGSEAADLEKSSKSKSSVVDLKGKSSSSSRRLEGSSEKNEEKRKSEKETSRRESSSSQYKDGKEKEREREREKERERERGSEKEKKVQDSRYERSEDRGSRREERAVKQEVEIIELQDEMHNSEAEKELDKHIKKRRDGSGDHDRLDDGREGDDRQISSREGHLKNGSYQEGRYKEKYREEVDRYQKHHDDKRRDERSSRTHTSERSDSKHYRDEIRYSDSRDKKTKLQDTDRGGSRRVDDHSTKLKNNRGRKKFSDEIEDQNDMKPRSAKEPREDTSKNGSSSSKFDSRSDRARMEHQHIDKVDSSMSNSRTKNSPNASTYAGKDPNRHNSRQPESMRKDSVSEDIRRSGGVSRDHATAAGGRERITQSRSSVKARLGDGTRSDAYMTDAGSIPHHDRISRSDARTSPNQLTEKSPSTSERRSERTSARHSLDIEEGGQRSSSSKGGRGESTFPKDSGRNREYLKEKPNEDDASQLDLLKREHVSVGPSSNRSSQLQGSSPGHLPPPPLVRLGIDSPSVLGSYEDEVRTQNGERKINTRYKRGGDAGGGRGPGTPWKSAPTWPSPVANGFMPLQHGPPAGFHPAVAQFPAPPLFGIRPSMDLNNTSYHIHEAGNRFPHARPYGWHNPADDCSPHLQVWDGNTNVFGDESHIFGRQEWDKNRHLMSTTRGWEMSSDMWSGQNGNANVEFPGPQKEHGYSQQPLLDEAWVGQTADSSRDEQVRPEQGTADASVIKLPGDASPVKQVIGASSKFLSEMTEPSKISSVKGTSERQSDNNVCYCCTYLSKLDISLDLVQPELYKQYMSLMEARDRNVTSNASSEEQRKNNVNGLRLVAKSKHRNSLFSTATDATFQRAMSLYRKQKEGMKEVMHCASLQVSSEQNKRPELTDGEKVQNKCPESTDGEKVTAKSANYMEDGLLPANSVPSGNYMEVVRASADTNVQGEHQPPGDFEEKDGNKPSDEAQQVDNIFIDAEEKGCDKISDAVISDKISDAVISVEGFEGSEAIIPECRVNLSRIHLSPESTH